VDKYLDAPQYVTTPQVKEMIAAGWEIGSHSMTHLDLSKAHDKVQYEMGTSKSTLEKALQTKITSFAYPFGTIDPYLVSKVQNYGYQSAVGLGSTYVHSMASIYYLSRMEIQGTYDMATFASMLPWHDVPNP
jgi:peptidoglycan/xylan/chitin deacetylase (PgdA/CDA1 family)